MGCDQGQRVGGQKVKRGEGEFGDERGEGEKMLLGVWGRVLRYLSKWGRRGNRGVLWYLARGLGWSGRVLRYLAS